MQASFHSGSRQMGSRRGVSKAARRKRKLGGAVLVVLEQLESRQMLATYTVAAGDTATLISDITASNAAGGPNTINLTPSTYTFTSANNYWYGPNALPPITTRVTINGNGATLTRSSSLPQTTAGSLRFFYISAGPATGAPGTLFLENLTLSNGLAKGGDSNGGGGGLGAGGAIFDQGNLRLNGVTTSAMAKAAAESGRMPLPTAPVAVSVAVLDRLANWAGPRRAIMGEAARASGPMARMPPQLRAAQAAD
jgi:hypothetical protein